MGGGYTLPIDDGVSRRRRRRTRSRRRPPRAAARRARPAPDHAHRRRPHAPDRRPVRDARRGARSRNPCGSTAALVVARDVPHEDLGIWIELPTAARDAADLRRRAGVAARAATASRRCSSSTGSRTRLRAALAEHAGDVRRAIEIGRGLDKVLLADHGDHHVVYARRLFRDRARLALSIYDDGRMVIVDGPESRDELEVRHHRAAAITSGSSTGTAPTSRGSRFPGSRREDREELARRIGQLVDQLNG